MKKIIAIAVMALGATQIEASDIGDIVRHIASDMNIRIEHYDNHKRVQHRHHRRQATHHTVKRSQKRAKRSNKHTKSQRKAHKLNFHTFGEYKKLTHTHKTHRRHKVHHSHKRHLTQAGNHSKKLGRYVGNGWYTDDDGYYNEEWEDVTVEPAHRWHRDRSRRQHGYRNYRRDWYLTYLYERSSFYDSYGFYYGYFDRYGFMFDGRYYSYDYNYTYQDRLHGKGIFEHKYYRPHRYRRAQRDSWSWEDDFFNDDVDGEFEFRISFK